MRISTPIRSTFLIGVLLTAGINLFAATVSDYKERVDTARTYIWELRTEAADPESYLSEPDDVRNIAQLVTEAVPATENIEWPGGSLATSNEWLHQRLNDLNAETDPAKRVAILNEIGERLDGIAVKIAELDTSSAADRSKDQDKQKLGEILGRPEFQTPDKPEQSLFQKWWRWMTDWFKGLFPQPAITPSAGTGFESISFILQIFIYILVAALLGFAVYKFAPLIARRFRRRVHTDPADRVILSERISAGVSPATVFSEAERLAREGDLRGAIRKGYIALLCELSDKKFIGLAGHKTNRDYLRDLRRQSELYGDVERLTNTFEANWYGETQSSTGDWDEFRSGYIAAIGKAGTAS